MSNIPEHILAEARRLAAEGMPLEQIAFFTRIDAEVIEADLKEWKAAMDHIPAEYIAMIQKLGRENTPVGRIAFMTHMSQSLVLQVLSAADIAPTENPTEE